MKAEDMILVSIDDHVIEPEDMFDNHMPDKYKDQAPRYVHDDTGRGYWEFQGLETGMSGLGAVASWPHEEWDMDPVDFPEMRPATYDVELRVRDMDANGQLTGMCFPTFAGFNGMSLARSTVDRDLTNAVVSAYNDWHIDELAGEHPGRFIPLAIVPTYDPQAMVGRDQPGRPEGLHRRYRCRRRLTGSACPPSTRTGTGIRSSGPSATTTWPCACTSAVPSGSSSGPRPPAEDNLIIMSPQLSAVATSDLMAGGVFNRFPSLKVAMSEGGIGWIPFFLDRMDRHVWNHRWTGLKVRGRQDADRAVAHPTSSGASSPTRLHCGSATVSVSRPSPGNATTRTPTRRGRARRSDLLGELEGAGCSDDEIEAISLEERLPVLQLRPLCGHPAASRRRSLRCGRGPPTWMSARCPRTSTAAAGRQPTRLPDRRGHRHSRALSPQVPGGRRIDVPGGTGEPIAWTGSFSSQRT